MPTVCEATNTLSAMSMKTECKPRPAFECAELEIKSSVLQLKWPFMHVKFECPVSLAFCAVITGWGLILEKKITDEYLDRNLYSSKGQITVKLSLCCPTRFAIFE